MTVRRNSETQKKLGILSNDQDNLYKLIETLYVQMNEICIVYIDQKYSLWDFSDKFQFHNEPYRPEFGEGSNIGRTAIETCERIELLLRNICEPSNFFYSFYLLLFDKTLGHTDYVLHMFVYKILNRQE